MANQPMADDSVGRMQFLLDLRRRGINDVAVLRALDEVPREHFVDEGLADAAYTDRALPIACGQTISQPYSAWKPGSRPLTTIVAPLVKPLRSVSGALNA